MPEPATTAPAPARPLVWLFAVMLLVNLWLTTRAWHASLLDRHPFRQTQTATSAYWIKEAGYQLAYETPLFGPPWSIPMEFPVYEWVVARASAALGTSLEPTARGVSFFFFLATLPAIYGLAGLLQLAPTRRLLVVSVLLASPGYLFWARTFMIETTALCFATWFLYALGRAGREGSMRYAAGATAFGALAALAKITTFLVFCLPAGAFFLWLCLQSRRNSVAGRGPAWRAPVLVGAPVLTALLIGAWWVLYSDQVKQSNPFSASLTSARLTGFNWGTLAQRVSPTFWLGIWNNLSDCVFSQTALVVFLLGLALAGGVYRRAALWGAAFFLGGVLLFANLFYLHDYYFCANAVFLLGGAGLVLAGVWDNVRLPLAARGLLLTIFFAAQLLLYERTYGRYLRRETPGPPGIAAFIREVVPPDGVLLVYGWDWNSLVPYYAQRRAVMVPMGREDDTNALETILAQLPPRRIAAMLVNTPVWRQAQNFLRWRTSRLNLTPAPFATSNEGDLYLAQELLPAATRRLARRDFATVLLANPARRSDFYVANLPPVAAAAIDQPIFTPRPVQGRAEFGFTTGDVDGMPGVVANAPAELQFAPPAGATRIEATVGLLNSAITGPTPTDGVDVLIFERRPDGSQQVLYQRNLDPLHRPADRGPQKISLALDGPVQGPLVFAIYPGPADNKSCDWSYWREITIR